MVFDMKGILGRNIRLQTYEGSQTGSELTLLSFYMIYYPSLSFSVRASRGGEVPLAPTLAFAYHAYLINGILSTPLLSTNPCYKEAVVSLPRHFSEGFVSVLDCWLIFHPLLIQSDCVGRANLQHIHLTLVPSSFNG